MKIYVLEHIHVIDGEKDIESQNFFGLYSTREKALQVIRELTNLPRFKDWPSLLEDSPSESGEGGFTIFESQLDGPHQNEGFTSWDEASKAD